MNDKQLNNKPTTNPVVAVKKEHDQAQDAIITLSSGVQVKLHPVASYVVREAQLRIPEPQIPLVPHPDAPDDPTKYMENPMCPDYAQAMKDYEVKLEQVGLDAVVLFGIELLSDISEDDGWLHNLKLIKLVDRDPEDEYEREFWYKKYVIANADIILRLSAMAALKQEDVDNAIESFQRS